jgi:2-methylcitrate dehydratase PrpD
MRRTTIDMPDHAQGITREVASFVVKTTYKEIPPEPLRLTQRSLIDGTAVMLSGSTEQSSIVLRRYLETICGKPESSVFGSTLKVPAPSAALANGAAGHAQDFDDTQVSSSPDRIYGLLLHPTPPALAATYALAEAQGVSGKEFMTAFSLGLEVELKIADAIHPFHYVRGLHTTGTIGAFGAVAAAGKLLGLSEQQLCCALGIVASMSAGIRSNFGNMTKHLHAGRAAENGVIAARLAQLGFTGDTGTLENPLGYFKVMGADFTAAEPEVLENPLWGYGKTRQIGFDVERITGRLGNPYAIVTPGISIKPYPSVVLSHPSMNALLELVQQHDVKPQDVEEVHVFAGANVVNILYAFPTTGTEGKFSLRFCLALILLYRRAGLRDFSDQCVASTEAQEIMNRIRISVDLEIEAKGYEDILSRIELRLKDGRILKKESGPYKGGPRNPLSEMELDEKFKQCAEFALSSARVGRALELLKAVEELDDMRVLIPALLPD